MPKTVLSSTDVIKISSHEEEPAPIGFISLLGTVVAHHNIIYFSSYHEIFSFTVPNKKWTKLPPSKYQHFTMAVVEDRLTTIGGWKGFSGTDTNELLSRLPWHSSWKEVLPPMPTKRAGAASLSTHTHLVVAGGWIGSHAITDIVEVLDTKTMQWSTASSIPKAVYYPGLTICGDYFYHQQGTDVYSCSKEALLESRESTSSSNVEDDSVWTRVADIPIQWASLVSLEERVLAIGGSNDTQHRTAAIHCYNRTSNSWSVVGRLPTSRSCVLATMLPSNGVVVVGGLGGDHDVTLLDIGDSK